MMKVLISIKLILLLTLISICLSFGVISHKYTKNAFNSGDKRFNNALSLLTKKAVKKKGGERNVKVVPVAAFRNFDNGINYKLLAAVIDLKSKKTDFMETDIYTPYSESENDMKPLFSFNNYREITSETFNLKSGILWNEISDFLSLKLARQNIFIKEINSILGTYKNYTDTSYYVVDMVVQSEGRAYVKNIVVDLKGCMNFEVLYTFDL